MRKIKKTIFRKFLALFILIINLFNTSNIFGAEMQVQKYNFQTKQLDPPITIIYDERIGPVGIDPNRDAYDSGNGMETPSQRNERMKKEQEVEDAKGSSISAEDSGSSAPAEKTAQKSCEKYKDVAEQDYKDYCSNIASCEVYNPTKTGLGIIKIQIIPFTPVISAGSAAGISADAYGEAYNAYLSTIVNTVPYLGVKPFEQAKVAYTETQNAIYNCAVLRVKLKVGKSIIELVKNNDTSNIVQKIESQNKTIEKELGDKKCNAPGDKDASYKKLLVENITYHYCNYKFYLNYLSAFPSYNVNQPTISAKVQTPGQDKYNSANAVSKIRKQSNMVTKEIEHSKQIYNLTFSAFSELENTYGLHIMLLLIYDDYVQIRKNYEKILSPISQLAYKIPQAQKQ